MISIRKALTAAVLAAGLSAAVGAVSADAATGQTGPHATGSVQCGSAHSASLPAPVMKAYNATTATDYQIVVFQPVLFRWSGSAWVENSSGMVFYGRASDVSAPSRYYDWYTGADRGNGTDSMTLVGSGYWKAAYRMWWYTGSSVTGSDYLWAASYYSVSPIGAVTTLSYCTS